MGKERDRLAEEYKVPYCKEYENDEQLYALYFKAGWDACEKSKRENLKNFRVSEAMAHVANNESKHLTHERYLKNACDAFNELEKKADYRAEGHGNE